MTDAARKRNFIDATAQPQISRQGVDEASRQPRAAHRWLSAALLIAAFGAPGRLPAEALVFLVQPAVWGAGTGHFDARALAARLSVALEHEVQVRQSDDVLSHWRTVQSGRGFDLALDEAHFTAYRIARHGFNVLAQAESEVRFAIVVRPRTLIMAPSDLTARKIAAPAPPALAALRLLNLFPDPVQGPELVVVASQAQALRALAAGEVSAAIVPMEGVERLGAVQIALETDASPGRAFSVSGAVSQAQRGRLLELLRDLSSSPSGRRVLSQVAVRRLEPVADSVYEDVDRLLRGTWGY